MTRQLSTQAAAVTLAVFVTFAVLLGLNSLANPEHAATQLAKTVATQPA